jgi:hypothetical protein
MQGEVATVVAVVDGMVVAVATPAAEIGCVLS